MNTFTRTVTDLYTEDGHLVQRTWILASSIGAVQIVFARQPHENGDTTWFGAGFNYHSPVAPDGEQLAPCDILEGGMCFGDGSNYPSEKLLREWLEFDCDDDLIWTAATTAFRERLMQS
ncbi:hypothetical protein [Streptosporangium sandarakinum]|uniref:hypothetical protein n=1 Tax=Streptosporangium sandarakinum TaxID=1260955 RepID=UPI0037AACA6D